MITSGVTIAYPTVPGVAPGTVLPSGPPGPSAYQIAGGDAVWGSVAAWEASLVGPPVSQAQVVAAVQLLLGAATGIARQDDLTAEVARAKLAEGGLMPNTVAAFVALWMAWIASLPTAPSGSGPTWWSNGGQPTFT